MGQATDIQRAYFEAIQAADFDRVRALFHPDYVFTDEEGTEHGVEGSIEKIATYTNAFPGFELDIHRQLEMGDVAVMEATIHGVHQNDLPGVPATGKSVKVEYCNVLEVRDGKIFREHDYNDNLKLLRQLGAASAPA